MCSCLAGSLDSFQVFASVASQAQLKLVADHGLLDRILMTVELVTNGCPDKVAAMGVEALATRRSI